jgi:hypothetical protein
LDWNSEFQPLSICVTALHLAKLADMTGTLPASTQVNLAKNVHKLMIFQIHTICDVVEMDAVIWVVLELSPQHFAYG